MYTQIVNWTKLMISVTGFSPCRPVSAEWCHPSHSAPFSPCPKVLWICPLSPATPVLTIIHLGCSRNPSIDITPSHPLDTAAAPQNAARAPLHLCWESRRSSQVTPGEGWPFGCSKVRFLKHIWKFFVFFQLLISSFIPLWPENTW